MFVQYGHKALRILRILSYILSKYILRITYTLGWGLVEGKDMKYVTLYSLKFLSPNAKGGGGLKGALDNLKSQGRCKM